jgi:hypothetical protein
MPREVPLENPDPAARVEDPATLDGTDSVDDPRKVEQVVPAQRDGKPPGEASQLLDKGRMALEECDRQDLEGVAGHAGHRTESSSRLETE